MDRPTKGVWVYQRLNRDLPRSVMHRTCRIVVLCSDKGRLLEHVIQWHLLPGLPIVIDIAGVVCPRRSISALQFVTAAGIRLESVEIDDSENEQALSAAVFDLCRSLNADLVVMARFLKKIDIPSDFRLRVLNVHGSLLPSFGGQGFYGRRLQQAVLESGVRVTGCTVHFATDDYDVGPIILQMAVPVESGDTVETLTERVFETECRSLKEAILLAWSGQITATGRAFILYLPMRL